MVDLFFNTTRSPDSVSSDLDTRNIDQLCKWAQDNGAYWSKVQFGVCIEPGVHGVVAKEDIQPYEKFIAIPNRLLFSYRLAAHSPLAQVFAEHPLEAKETEEVLFALYLLYERRRGEASFWHPFIKSLPDNIDTPADWQSFEAAQLQDADLAHDARHRLTKLLRQFMQVKRTLQLYPELIPEPFQFKEYLWAHKATSTRCFGTYTPHTCMAPVADLLNHNTVDTVYLYGEGDEVDRSYEGFSSDEDQDDPIVEAKTYGNLTFEAALGLVSESLEPALKETLLREARYVDGQTAIDCKMASSKQGDQCTFKHR